MSRPLSSQPPSPIQRLLIFHLNFAEKCMNGHALGEGASLEELHEQILFYHRDRRLADNSEEIDGKGSSQNLSLLGRRPRRLAKMGVQKTNQISMSASSVPTL